MLFKSHIHLKHIWELAWVSEGKLCETLSKFSKFHGRPAVIVSTSNFERHKSGYFNPKGSFFVLLVGFP